MNLEQKYTEVNFFIFKNILNIEKNHSDISCSAKKYHSQLVCNTPDTITLSNKENRYYRTSLKNLDYLISRSKELMSSDNNKFVCYLNIDGLKLSISIIALAYLIFIM